MSNARLVLLRPTSSEWSEANARKPLTAASDVKNPRDDRDPRSMDQPAVTVAVLAASRFSDAEHQHGGEHREDGGAVPGSVVAPLLDQDLGQRRPEGDAEIEAERVVAQRLPHPRRRREVGEQREAGHEERRLGDALHQPYADDEGQGLGVRKEHHAECSQRGAEDHQRSAALGVGEPASERSAHQRGHAERTERHPGAGLVGPDRPGDIEREGQDRHAHGGEVGEVGDAEHDEGRREDAAVMPVPRHTETLAGI